jgi:hypothetical protein
LGSANPHCRRAGARARDVFGCRHGCKNDCDCKHNRKSCEDETRGHNARSLTRTDLLNLSRAIGSPRSLARDGSVQDVLVPFVNFDDGGAHRGDDSNQQSYRASQTGPRIDVASQWDEALKSWNQDRNASKAWAMRMPALRTTKNAVMASNMQIPVRPSSVKGSAHGVKNNSIEWRMSALS